MVPALLITGQRKVPLWVFQGQGNTVDARPSYFTQPCLSLFSSLPLLIQWNFLSTLTPHDFLELLSLTSEPLHMLFQGPIVSSHSSSFCILQVSTHMLTPPGRLPRHSSPQRSSDLGSCSTLSFLPLYPQHCLIVIPCLMLIPNI